MSGRRWRTVLVAAAVCVAAAAGLTAQPLSAVARSILESALLLPVLDPDGRPLRETGLAVWCSPGSRYHFTAQRLVPERGLFLHYGGMEPPTWPRLTVPRTVTPGGPLRVSVASAVPLAGLSVTVELPGGERVVGRGFAVATDSPGDSWAALLGIPSTAAAGTAKLLVAGRTAAAAAPAAFRLLLVQPLTVGARTFAEEEIPLRAELATLRRAPDPRRQEQSRELWRLLSSWRPDAHRHLGPLRLPLGEVRRTAGFGDRRTYLYEDGNLDVSIHNGIDFGAPEGTVVTASGSGTVMMARARIVTGLSVVIEHLPGVYSLYYHLARILVREGQHLAAGAVLGTVGSTGLATGPHLHWEVRAGGVAIDPDAVAGVAGVAGVPLVDTAGDRVIIVW
jgi:murein DD-endopeptidase MepM/ murein hydrolase activator NlpD